MRKNISFDGPLNNVEHVYAHAIQVLFDVFEEYSEGTVIVDDQARVVWMNTRYAARFGSTVTEAVGRPVEEVIPGSLMREVVHSGEPILLDVMGPSENPLVVMRLPIKDGKGKVLGAIGFALFDKIQKLAPLAAAHAKIQTELRAVRRALDFARSPKYSFSSFEGESPAILCLKAEARRVASMNAPVLIMGETGTGKELLAHAIHGASPRAGGPLVSVNMGAIPENLLEAEFFGVAPGAYTGAGKSGRVGKIELAQGGTLFLDEIADLPLTLQGKLLRVLQENEYEPLGSNDMRRADVRIIAATSADLAQMVKNKHFRIDLYYRLNVLPLHIPPLRERKDCLPRLGAAILNNLAVAANTEVRTLRQDALGLLASYSWPGNVRELRNLLERASMLSNTAEITAADIAPLLPQNFQPSEYGVPEDYEQAMHFFEEHLLRRTLAASDNNVPLAAKRLGLGRSTLYKKLAKLRCLPLETEFQKRDR